VAASADQLAAIISENEKAWRNYEANIDSCNKAAAGLTPDNYIQAMGCIKNAQEAANRARSATSAIVAFGSPPPELAALVTETLDALAPLSKSNAEASCQDATSDPCAKAVDQIDEAASTLVEVLDGWAPYVRTN
jgi:hypothetical protein